MPTFLQIESKKSSLIDPRLSIMSFPPELLELIFTHTLPSPDLRTSFSPHLSPMNLTHVCHRWRSIALALPALWCTFALDLIPLQIMGHSRYHPSLLNLWLERGRSHLLDVRINQNGSSLLDYVTQRDLGDFNECVKLLFLHSNRWKEFFISVDPWVDHITDALLSLRQSDLMNLQVVHYLSKLVDSDIPYSPKAFDYFWHALSPPPPPPPGFSKPLHLHVSGTLPSTAPWLQFQHISFSGTSFTETCILLALSGGGCLESLDMAISSYDKWVGEPIILPSLKRLKLLLPNRSVSPLDWFNLPTLEELELTTEEDDDDADDDDSLANPNTDTLTNYLKHGVRITLNGTHFKTSTPSSRSSSW